MPKFWLKFWHKIHDVIEYIKMCNLLEHIAQDIAVHTHEVRPKNIIHVMCEFQEYICE